ncbi:DUF4145 domain-containing protein [Pseudomonas sp. Irchel s3h14]|uniref:DUF4145 domain-containing protein n=1 Tax=Pseudomonas sp. Irchel s3h14 TaxID=2009179 RepID=UPI000BA49B4E|nr:DUF4145 domain-containing protein [Pseudomonas sp. Irchel s3h14]
MSEKKVRSECTKCQRTTNQEVQGSHFFEGNPEDYHYTETHEIIKCCGCDFVSFRRVIKDIEAAYFIDEDVEWVVPTDTFIYPKASIAKLDGDKLPDIVGSIYSEVCTAFEAGSLTLAGIGLRATIEAICNDLKVTGRDLNSRINSLASKGFISKKDSVRLHSIRFMGNDAAHEIITPSKKSLQAALVIIEHLITTVYLLDKDSKKHLQLLIEEYMDFEKLLLSKLNDYKAGDEYPLAKYLGKDMRLIAGNLKKITSELNRKIGKKEFTALSFGKDDKFMGSDETLLHYVVT